MADDTNQEPKHPGGRPLTFPTPEELNLAIQLYFDKQDPHVETHMVATGVNANGKTMFEQRDVLTEQKPYTISGLAMSIGLDRRSLLNYKERDEFFPSIQGALDRYQEHAESQLFGPYGNGAKFNLVNNYNGKYQPWADKTAVDHTTKDQPIPLLAGLAPAKLEVEDEDAARSDDSSSED